jgi:hypothetical protein
MRALFLVIDASAVGRGCAMLMLSVVYKQRTLPLVWLVAKGAKGHFPEADHCALVAQIQPFLPLEAEVTLLGDGEFDGMGLLKQIVSAPSNGPDRRRQRKIAFPMDP